MSFESELQEALRRKAAPDGFTDKVMNAIERHQVRPRRVPRIAAAAAALVIVLGGWTIHRVEERREGERAKAQLMTALRLTSKKLQETQQHVQDISTR